MKVQFVIAEMAVGGAERMVVELLRSAVAHGDQTALLAAPGPLDAELDGLEVERRWLTDGRRPSALLRASGAAARATRSFHPDIVHVHNVRVTAVARAGVQAARPLGRPPLLTTFHGVPEQELDRAARILRMADLVVCVAEDLRDELAHRGLAAERLRVIPNGVPAAAPLSPERRTEIDAELGLGDAAAVVSIVGRLAPQKAHDRFLRAVAVAANLQPLTRFLVVGDGPRRAELEALATELGISDRVSFLGIRGDAPDLIARSDLLVFSSVWEGLSIAALEALARGVPVISTDVSGAVELLSTGAGIIVPHEDAALANAIVSALGDPALRETMAAEGRRLHAERFSVERMADAYRDLYRTLTAS